MSAYVIQDNLGNVTSVLETEDPMVDVSSYVQWEGDAYPEIAPIPWVPPAPEKEQLQTVPLG